MAERAAGEIPQQSWLRGHWLHASYTLLHKWYVAQECWKYGLYYQGIVHDWTKFTPSEWNAYVGFHFLKTLTYEQYEPVQLLHAHRNPHHWEAYVKPTPSGPKVLEIPDHYRKEMIADWKGANKAKGYNDVLMWYRQNRERIILHPNTRNWVEIELGYQGETDG